MRCCRAEKVGFVTNKYAEIHLLNTFLSEGNSLDTIMLLQRN